MDGLYEGCKDRCIDGLEERLYSKEGWIDGRNRSGKDGFSVG